jgi:hypothetical protein
MTLFEKARIWFVALVAGAAVLAVAILFELAQIYPYRPHTYLGWMVFAVGVPLAWIISGALEALIDREPVGRWVDRQTADQRFSWGRALYLLVRTLFVLALFTFTIWLAGRFFG